MNNDNPETHVNPVPGRGRRRLARRALRAALTLSRGRNPTLSARVAAATWAIHAARILAEEAGLHLRIEVEP